MRKYSRMEMDMNYEELLCELFDCSQDDDPLELASADRYDGIIELEKGKGFEFRVGLFSALRKLYLKISKSFGLSEENEFSHFTDRYDELVDIIFTTKDQQAANDILNLLCDVYIEFKEFDNKKSLQPST